MYLNSCNIFQIWMTLRMMRWCPQSDHRMMLKMDNRKGRSSPRVWPLCDIQSAKDSVVDGFVSAVALRSRVHGSRRVLGPLFHGTIRERPEPSQTLGDQIVSAVWHSWMTVAFLGASVQWPTSAILPNDAIHCWINKMSNVQHPDWIFTCVYILVLRRTFQGFPVYSRWHWEVTPAKELETVNIHIHGPVCVCVSDTGTFVHEHTHTQTNTQCLNACVRFVSSDLYCVTTKLVFLDSLVICYN